MTSKADLKKYAFRLWNDYVVQPDRTNAVFITVIGTIVFIVLLNIVVYIGLFDPNLGQAGAVRKWNLLLNLNHPVDTIILGDSSCVYGVLPDIVEQQFGGPAINLAIDAGSAPLYDAWMLSTYLKRFDALRNVILVCTVHTYTGDTPLDCVAKIPLPWGFWEKMVPKPSWTDDVNSLLFIFVDRYFPLYSQKLYISEILQTPGIPWILFNRVDVDLSKGANTGYPNPDPLKVETQSQAMLKAIGKNSFEISSDNERSLSSMINLAKQYNFNIYIVNSPIYDQLYNDPAYQIYFEKYTNDISKYVDNNTTHLILKTPMTFTKLQMQNPNHLIRSAAEVYTRSMTAEILAIQNDDIR